MKINTIYQEDCLLTMGQMPNNFIDLVITSPPYGTLRNYSNNSSIQFDLIAQDLFRVVKQGGVIVWIVNDQTLNGNESGESFRQALYFQELGFNLFDTMIYLKKPQGARGNMYGYWQTFEYMFIFSKGKPKTINLLHDRENKNIGDKIYRNKRLKNDKLKVYKEYYETKKLGRRTNVWEYNNGSRSSSKDKIASKHPAIFPEKLVQDHIESWSNIHDIVYDPFMGSGTTAKMCKLMNRNYIGSEVNIDYVKISEERLSHY